MKWSNGVRWLDSEIPQVAGRGKQNLITTSTLSAPAANNPQRLKGIVLASPKKKTQTKTKHHPVEEKHYKWKGSVQEIISVCEQPLQGRNLWGEVLQNSMSTFDNMLFNNQEVP